MTFVKDKIILRQEKLYREYFFFELMNFMLGVGDQMYKITLKILAFWHFWFCSHFRFKLLFITLLL